MLSHPLQPRAVISALLLLVQVLGLGHVALAEHAPGEGGAVVDVALLTTDAHDDAGGHLCAGELALHAGAPEDCLVLAGWSAPSLLAPVVARLHLAARPAAQPHLPSVVAAQLDALARAPKGSPPKC